MRGLALSVDVPLGGKTGFSGDDFFVPPDPGSPGRQDFVLFSDPEFFAANIREAAAIFSIMSITSNAQKGLHLLAYILATGAYKQAWIGLRSLTRRVANPLQPVFHSGTPYLLGDQCVVK